MAFAGFWCFCLKDKVSGCSPGSSAGLLHCVAAAHWNLRGFCLLRRDCGAEVGHGCGSTWEMTRKVSPLAEPKYILSKVPLGVSRHEGLLPWWGPAGAEETGRVHRTELFLPIWSCYSWCNSPEFRRLDFSKSLLQLTQSLPHLHILLSNSSIQKCSLLV